MNTKVAVAILGFLGSAIGAVVVLPSPADIVLASVLVLTGIYVVAKVRGPSGVDTKTHSVVETRGRTIETTRSERSIEVASNTRKWTFRTISKREVVVGVAETARSEHEEQEREPERPQLGA